MGSGLVLVLFTVFLTEALCLLPLLGEGPAWLCPPRWRLFGQRCFAFYPVWSSWSRAESLCFQAGASLVSLHTPEEMLFLREISNTTTAVWLGDYKGVKSDTWSWSNESPFRVDGVWNNKACLEMEPKSGELRSAPCGQLHFYICSIRVSSSSVVVPGSSKPSEPDVVPGVSLFDVIWGYSDLLVEEILHSSPFFRELLSGRLTPGCYASFIRHEALYLRRVVGTLQALMGGLRPTDGVRPLLLDTVEHYSRTNQSLLASSAPPWLQDSLQTFHSVVLEDPVYWLVALSARASLHNFLIVKLHQQQVGPPQVSGSLVQTYQTWRNQSLKEVAWTNRYKKVLEEQQDQMDTFKAINIFRQHMMNQKRLHGAVMCDGDSQRL